MAGDFFQLPPIGKKDQVVYSFESESWKECIEENGITVELTTGKGYFGGVINKNLYIVFRQDDIDFVRMLNELRRGVCGHVTTHKLKNCSRDLPIDDKILPTRLYTT